ncbi:MAG: rhodanese-like domain-containing protein [Anaerolineales bacterium]|jgi:rhodanese-related sulfurtransferase
MSFFNRIFGGPVSTLSTLELHKKLKNRNQPYVLDVRQPEEFRLGHIDGAKLIPLGELSNRLREIPKGREIVCICATGHRSVPAVRKLTAAGYTASSMKNGMISWQMAKLTIQKGLLSLTDC